MIRQYSWQLRSAACSAESLLDCIGTLASAFGSGRRLSIQQDSIDHCQVSWIGFRLFAVSVQKIYYRATAMRLPLCTLLRAAVLQHQMYALETEQARWLLQNGRKKWGRLWTPADASSARHAAHIALCIISDNRQRNRWQVLLMRGSVQTQSGQCHEHRLGCCVTIVWHYSLCQTPQLISQRSVQNRVASDAFAVSRSM